MSRLEEFAKDCAEFLVLNDWDTRNQYDLDSYFDSENAEECTEFQRKLMFAYEETKQNATDNPNDLWDYLWRCCDAEVSRKICVEYRDIIEG